MIKIKIENKEIEFSTFDASDVETLREFFPRIKAILVDGKKIYPFHSNVAYVQRATSYRMDERDPFCTGFAGGKGLTTITYLSPFDGVVKTLLWEMVELTTNGKQFLVVGE